MSSASILAFADTLVAELLSLFGRMAAVENEMKKLTDIAVVLARYDERILAVTTRLNLMDKRWEELRQSKSP